MRGGFLGYRTWPLKQRLALFGICLVCFWGIMAWVIMSSGKGNQTLQGIFGFLIIFGLLTFLVLYLKRAVRRQRQTTAARRRAREVNELLNPARAKRGWWQLFARKSE
jgi:drug/metabolite transporter (DMT)-like permease